MQKMMMSNVRVVHSWWSLPMMLGRWNQDNQIELTMRMTALSLAYAKANGAYMVCYCDKAMEPYLSKLGYDEIHATLDAISDDMIGDPVFMWAAGKFYAMKDEPLGAVHIDYDVFLTKPESVESLKMMDGIDILFSHIENSEDYEERQMFASMFPTCNMDITYAANVGVIAFNSQEAKDEYFNHYFHYLKNVYFDMEGNKDLNADLILEQTYLAQMLNKYSYATLIGDQRTDSISSMQSRAIEIGFEHLIGRTKYSPFATKLVQERLAKKFPEMHAIVESMDFTNLEKEMESKREIFYKKI